MRAALAATLLALSACGDAEQPAATPAPGHPLEQAAIERGLIPDPARAEPTGLYARDTDRLCVVPLGDGAEGEGGDAARYSIGAFVDYGEGLRCAASGQATLSADRLSIALGDGECRFDALFDGDRIAFPADLPDACRAFCDDRASLSAVQVERLSDSRAEAGAFRLPDGRRPCTS